MSHEAVNMSPHSHCRPANRAEVDRIDKERNQIRPAAVDSKEEAIADLKRIRQALRTEWEAIKDSLDPKRMDDLLFCCTVFGLGENDMFAPIRTDWWRASYKPDVIVPGIGKACCNYIDMTGEDVWLRVPECSKEPTNSVELNISEESPLLATLLRAYKDTALEKNDGFLFSHFTHSHTCQLPHTLLATSGPPSVLRNFLRRDVLIRRSAEKTTGIRTFQRF